MRVLLDGEFFAEWGGSLVELAEFSEVDVERLSPDLAERRAAMTQQNNAAYESAIALLTSAYPPSEIATWEIQRQEAAAWDADDQAPTPWIDGAAAARGIDRVEYLTRTLTKASSFAQASAWLTGRRQMIDDQLKVAGDQLALDAVLIDYTLPGAGQ